MSLNFWSYGPHIYCTDEYVYSKLMDAGCADEESNHKDGNTMSKDLSRDIAQKYWTCTYIKVHRRRHHVVDAAFSYDPRMESDDIT